MSIRSIPLLLAPVSILHHDLKSEDTQHALYTVNAMPCNGLAMQGYNLSAGLHGIEFVHSKCSEFCGVSITPFNIIHNARENLDGRISPSVVIENVQIGIQISLKSFPKRPI